MFSIFTKWVRILCEDCDRDCMIEWVSYFGKLSRRPIRFCPSCGSEKLTSIDEAVEGAFPKAALTDGK